MDAGKEKIGYPVLELDLKKLRHNVDQVVQICEKQGIGVAGVIKGFTGIPQGAKEFKDAGCQYIASSRLEQIEGAMTYGIGGPFMLIRTPMLSEAEDVVRLADISLNSEIGVLKQLNREAARQGKLHNVLLMIELGDLREGFWSKEELLDAALLVEKELDHLFLAGVGVNLGCYGSIMATCEKMEELIADAEMIETAIGRRLDIISGGATSSLPLVMNGTMPSRINNLRIGEGIILARDLQVLYQVDMSFMHRDAFLLKAEVIEAKNKPSYPIGVLAFDAFGKTGTYTDRGMRRKALLALGKADFAYMDMIYPKEKGVEILGASSDHLILDIEEAERNIDVGDILEFDLSYASLVFASSSPSVRIQCKSC